MARRHIPQPVAMRNHISHETVAMYHPEDEAAGEADALKRSMEQFQELTERRRIEREIQEYMATIEAELGPLDLDEDEDEGPKVPQRTVSDIRSDSTLDPIKKAAMLAALAEQKPVLAGDMSRLYIPPAMRRGGMSSGGEVEANSTIKVTNYDSLMAGEEMMRDMFENFGRIVRVSFTVIRERDGYRYPVAFIKYQLKGSAEDAISRLHGKPVRSSILSVEMAEERSPKSLEVRQPVQQRRHLTGYGKDLAQSTTKGFASLNSSWS